MSEFEPRIMKPEKGNPYYNTIANGGWSPAIKGKPTDADCDVLSNCVGYAIGRFNEIGGEGFKYLRSVNAENFIQYAEDLEVGSVPKVGACMVWKKGATLNADDGAGHVAIVEIVYDENHVMTSESGYNCRTPFWTQHRRCGSGNWGQDENYTFLGFIYNPAVESAPEKEQLYRVRRIFSDAASQIGAYKELKNAVLSCIMGYSVFDTNGNVVYAEPHLLPDNTPYPKPHTVLHFGDSGDEVKWLQYRLILNGYSCGTSGIDGHYGNDTKRAVDAFCSVNGVSPDNFITALGGDSP